MQIFVFSEKLVWYHVIDLNVTYSNAERKGTV